MPQDAVHNVLVAHQSTIPHYRARFYELVEVLRPRDWRFRVVFDPAPGRIVDSQGTPCVGELKFPVCEIKTNVIIVGKRHFVWQNFLSEARKCDLLITDSRLANIAYPAAALIRRAKTPHVVWGHSGDLNHQVFGLLKRGAEKLKHRMIRNADGFFAYTPGDAERVHKMGFPEDRVFVMNNTIDIASHRMRWAAIGQDREILRVERGLAGRKIVVFVGRLLPEKRIVMLCDIFRHLYAIDPDYHLVAIGAGGEAHHFASLRQDLGDGAVTICGPIFDLDALSPWFVIADVFLMPADVGLAPLQAICFDVPVVTFRRDLRGPEFEYLQPANSMVMEPGLGAGEAAVEIERNWTRLNDPLFRSGLFATIDHLTIEEMAARFVDAVSRMLVLGRCK